MVKRKCDCKQFCRQVEGKIKGQDIFGESITLSYNSEFSEITTVCGGIMSLFVVVLSVVYLWQQLTILLENKKGVAFSVSDFFTDDETMSDINIGDYDDSFNMIIGTTNKELDFF